MQAQAGRGRFGPTRAWSSTLALVLALTITAGLFSPALANHEDNGEDPVIYTPEVWRGWVADEWENDFEGGNHGDSLYINRGWWADGDASSQKFQWRGSMYYFFESWVEGCGWQQTETAGANSGTGETQIYPSDLHGEYGDGYSAGEEGLTFNSALQFTQDSSTVGGVFRDCSGNYSPQEGSGGGMWGGDRTGAVVDLSAIPTTISFRHTYSPTTDPAVTRKVQVCMSRSTVDTDGDQLPDDVDLDPLNAAPLTDLGIPGGPPDVTIHARLEGGPSGKRGVPECPTPPENPAVNTPEVWRGWVAVEAAANQPGSGDVLSGWWVDDSTTSLDVSWAQDVYRYGNFSCGEGSSGHEYAGSGGGTGYSQIDAEEDFAVTNNPTLPQVAGEGLIFRAPALEGEHAVNGLQWTCDGVESATSTTEPSFIEAFSIAAGVVTDLSDVPTKLSSSYTGSDAVFDYQLRVCMSRSTVDSDSDSLPDDVDLAPGTAAPASDLGIPGGPQREPIPAKRDGGPSGNRGVPHCPGQTQVPPCPEDGLVRADVLGREPTYVALSRKLSAFPNKRASCFGMWAPHLDGGFVPQGVAPAGDRMWVSGYFKAHKDDKPVECAVYLMDPATGKRGRGYMFTKKHHVEASIASGFFDPLRLPKRCGHAGGVSLLSDGRLLVVDTKTLFVLKPALFGRGNPIKKVIKLVDRFPDDATKFNGSFLVDGVASSDPDEATIYIGTWAEKTQSTLRRFTVAEILADNRLRPGDDDLSAMYPLPVGAQGGAFAPSGELVVSSSVSRCGRLSWIDLDTGSINRYGFGPGVEEISFVGDRLWATFEAGTRLYIKKTGARFFPLIASFAPSRITEPPESDLQNPFCAGL